MTIRKAYAALVALALLAGATSALADPPAMVGRLNYLSGTVSFAPADAPADWVAAPINRPLTSGDRLWTDSDGRTEMRIGATAIRMAALTSMDVLRLDELGTQLRLAQGTLNVQLRPLDSGERFEISTPSGAVLLTQPGSYRVNVDPAGTTTAVLVRRGQAEVLTNNAPYQVRDNQLSFISAQGEEVYAAPAPDEFDNWAMARDRQEERIVATRYVPSAMTGYEDLDQHGTWRTVPEYGAVWVPTAVSTGWAPYRQGHWVWISPWGWTWVDDAPWGFAPYHYGRWVWLGNHWAWAPGARVARPVYAPALVAFVGGANWSVRVGGGPAIGWVPLGWREPYIPWYRHSPAYVRNVNITHVTNVTVINHYANVNNVNPIRYVNRDVPSGTTVVARDTFVSARRVHDAVLTVPGHTLAAARVTHDSPVAQPERASHVAARPSPRLPATIAAREVVAASAPPAPVAPVARAARDGNAVVINNNPGRAAEYDRRVRVIGAQTPSTVAAPPRAADTRSQPAATVQPAPAIAPPTPVAPPPAATAAPAAPVAPVAPPVVERRGPPREPRVNPQPAPVAAPVPATAPPQVDAQAQQQRQAQQEQQRQARLQADAQAQQQRLAQQEQQRQAHQQQQARLQAQKEQQHLLVQQRAQQVQQQRELQYQQAQQAEQQRQLRHQQQAQRQAERAEKPRRAEPTPQTPPAPPPR